MLLDKIEGKHTAETLSTLLGVQRQSAINLVSRLKSQGYITTTGGGRQKRIYTISRLVRQKPNGFFTLMNRHAQVKLSPYFEHVVHGRYTVEDALIDGLMLGDARSLEASSSLFARVKDWKRLFAKAKRKKVTVQLFSLYDFAKRHNKARKMPLRYL